MMWRYHWYQLHYPASDGSNIHLIPWEVSLFSRIDKRGASQWAPPNYLHCNPTMNYDRQLQVDQTLHYINTFWLINFSFSTTCGIVLSLSLTCSKTLESSSCLTLLSCFSKNEENASLSSFLWPLLQTLSMKTKILVSLGEKQVAVVALLRPSNQRFCWLSLHQSSWAPTALLSKQW